ncbi:MAG: FeoA domain-containing protein [Candidatus Odinarchaeia archaeon]
MKQSEAHHIGSILVALLHLEEIVESISIKEISFKTNIPEEDLGTIIEDLASLGLITYDAKGVKLTNKGRQMASYIQESKLTEDILREYLEFKGGEVVLKPPYRFRYRGPKWLQLREKEIIPLSAVEPPAKVVIKTINTRNLRLIQQLASIGILPNVKAEVKSKASIGGALILKIKDFEVAIGNNVASNILVSIIN